MFYPILFLLSRAWSSAFASSPPSLSPAALATRAEFVFEATILGKSVIFDLTPRTVLLLEISSDFNLKGDVQTGLVNLVIPGGVKDGTFADVDARVLRCRRLSRGLGNNHGPTGR